MSRSGLSDDGDNWRTIMFAGAVKKAINGVRGQRFLRLLGEALDEMPEKRLGRYALVDGKDFCAIGVALKKVRGDEVFFIHCDEPDFLASKLDVAESLVQQIIWENDEFNGSDSERWNDIRAFVRNNLKEQP